MDEIQQQYYDEQQALEREPHGFFGEAIDLFSRLGYFSAKFFDELASKGFEDVGNALISAGAEAIDPQTRPKFADVIRHLDPDINDVAAEILGFGADVTADPLNFVSLGSLGATRVLGRPLSKLGLMRYNAEIGDALEAAGWGVKKIGAMTKLARETTEEAGGAFVKSLIDDSVEKLGPELVGQVPNSDIFSVVMKGLGIAHDDAYLTKLGQATDIGEAIAADHGIGTAEKVRNFLEILHKSPDPRASLIETFGEDVAMPAVKYLDERGNSIMGLADVLKAGQAKPLEAKTAFELVKKFSSVDPFALEKFQKKFPEMADLALKVDDLEKVAYREAESTAGKKIAELTGLDVASKEVPKHEFFDQGGIKIAGRSIVSSRFFDKISQITGLAKTKEKLGEVKVIQGLVGAFNRNFKLPTEYVKIRQDLERELQSIENVLLRNTSEIFGGLSKEKRELITKVGMDFDAAQEAEKLRMLNQAKDEFVAGNPDKPLTDKIIKKLTNSLNTAQKEVIHESVLAKHGLKDDPEAFAAYVKLTHAMNEIGMKNFQLGLADEMSASFQPLIHEIAQNPQIFKQFLKGADIEGLIQSGFKTIQEAEAAGYKVEMNAMPLYMARALAAKETAAKEAFNDAVKISFGSLKELPYHMRKDIQFIGDSKMPAGWGEGTKAGLRLYDKVLGAFKKYATAVRPSFGARQLFSNSLQEYLALGPQVFHALDPRSQYDALAAVMHHYGAIQDSSAWLERGVIETPFGKRITGQEFTDKIAKWGVIRGTNIAGETYERNAAKSLEEAVRKFNWNDRSRNGLKKLLQLGIKYTNIPSYIEDIARTTLFAQALRMGYDDRSAVNLVNSALFDYTHGLSRFGRQIGQRVFPFFSFSNFAIPFISKIAMAHPVRIANIHKFAESFFGAMNGLFGGEHLNPSERAALPGFLLEQNNYLESLSEDGKALFRTFSNFSPLDVMGGLQVDEHGDVDMRQTVQQVIMSQLAPFIKMPLEVLFNRNFFTGQAIDNGGKKNIGRADFNTLIGNMTGMAIGGGQGNVLLGLAGKYGAQTVATPQLVQDALKKLIGWEPGIDHRTGEETVYVNPWMLYGLTNTIPSLGQAVRISNNNKQPTDKWLDFMLGVGTINQDLPRNAIIRTDEQKRELEDLKYQMHSAIREGRMDDAEQRLQDLQELMLEIAQKQQLLNAFPIRGMQ